MKKSFRCPVYDVPIHFVYGSPQQAVNYFNEKMPDEPPTKDWDELLKTREGEAGIIVWDNNLADFYIYIKEPLLKATVINHECRHLCDLVLEHRRIEDKWEAPAFYEEYLYKTFVKFIGVEQVIRVLRLLKKQ
jgi:hypothetical protein